MLIHDDEQRIRNRFVERLGALKAVSDSFDVQPITNERFTQEIAILEERRRLSRQGSKSTSKSLIDDAQILMVDYDLLQSSGQDCFMTAEIVAYLARCYSKCGLIIGVNQFGENIFDLTLRGHVESYCDLNLGGVQIDNPGLWSATRSGFRPWYWPELPISLEKWQKRIRDAEQNIEKNIMEVLGLNDIFLLPKSTSQFIGTDPATTTFKDFAKSPGRGLSPKDRVVEDEDLARIAAARISKWLERMVLSGQDVLIDAPHLISRFPSLLTSDHAKIESWNSATSFVDRKKLPMDHAKIEKFSFKKDFWLSRPAWFWRRIADAQKIKEVAHPWETESSDFLFCEDSSTFEKRDHCKEFTADVDSPYKQRYVHAEPFDANYQPLFRLL
jgi:hypothetical protein